MINGHKVSRDNERGIVVYRFVNPLEALEIETERSKRRRGMKRVSK